MTHIGQKIIEQVREIASENPDYIYEITGGSAFAACRYIHNGQPSCIVGKALFRLGMITTHLEHLDDNYTIAGALLAGMEVKLDFDEQAWLNSVQFAQDRQIPWGRAVSDADARMLVPA